jgi:hypothetical protein
LATDLVLTRHFDTWDGGIIRSTDVAGITYHAPSGHLYLADSEIDELSVFNGENIFEVSLRGDQVFRGIKSGNNEPTGITYNEFDGFFYITNDSARKIYRYNSNLNKALASVTTTNAVSNARDPEDITSDPATGFLYVADGMGGGRQVLIYDSALKYKGKFSVAAQLEDPEGIAFDPISEHLFLVSTPDMAVAEYTLNGTFVTEYDISGFVPAPVAPQGLAFAPTSDPADNPSALALYIVDGMIDNYPDGRVYEAVVVGEGQNRAPQVSAGVDQSILFPGTATLNGTVSDDGLPDPPASLTTTWAKFSGPGNVTFANASAVDTTATFSSAGTYVLRLSANDSQLVAADDVTISVVDGSTPLTVNFRNGVNGYAGMQDARIESATPSTNYGADTALFADGGPDRGTLLKWDLTSLPAASQVLAASMTFYVTNSSTNTYEIYQLLRDWTEANVTWNVATGTASWQTAGAQGSTDRGSTVLGQFPTGSTGTITVNLNAAGLAVVQSWINNPWSNFGLIVQDYVEGDDSVAFSSSEAATTSNRPLLSITYRI